MTKRIVKHIYVTWLTLLPITAIADEPIVMDTVTVTGGVEEVQTLPGSATWIDTTALEQYEHTDIHKVLSKAPGVYIRDEDGYGLRPNIGMRGAPAERSQKINIMEDGILIGPAPYSAPAAYYFPNVSRMSAVEVYKGPVSIAYGPNTVGGALNLITTPIPEYFSGEVNAGIGSDRFRRLHSTFGSQSESGQWGWLVEGFTMASDGFKDLDNGEDTGFERNDIDLKLSYKSIDTKYDHRVVLKLGAANEQSDETYLGLTDEDFYITPYRRYAASQLDRMDWDHNKIHLDYHIQFSDGLRLTTRTYRNDFDRAWRRFDGFRNNTEDDSPLLRADFTIDEILQSPNDLAQNRYYQILAGLRDSSGTEKQKLDVVTNDRDYLSQGIEWLLQPSFDHGNTSHEMTLGLRYHKDEVERMHTVRSYNMVNGDLVFDGIERAPRLVNKGETQAWSLFARDEIEHAQWRYTLGLRMESMDTKLTDLLNSDVTNDSETIFIPGAGVYYQIKENIGLLAGANRGFSPKGPGSDADAETSINYEAGMRYQEGSFNLESIFFFSDYSNLLGRCRASDATNSDCVEGEEINGGAVEISGMEFNATHAWKYQEASIPLKLVYTYTQSAFQSSFNTGFAQWGNVSRGDELPYLPEHILNLELGYEVNDWSLGIAAKYVSEMREVAGNGDIPDIERVGNQFIMDLAVNYFYNDSIKLQAKVINLFDEVDLVSRRPFGARPNRPRSFELGVQYLFE